MRPFKVGSLIQKPVMKKLLVLTVILVFVSQVLMAQTKTDSIEIKRSFWGNYLAKYDGKKVRTVHKQGGVLIVKLHSRQRIV